MWSNLPFIPLTLSFSANDVLTIASNKNYLLLSAINSPTPTEKHYGQTLAIWSPNGLKLATIDEADDQKIVIWEK